MRWVSLLTVVVMAAWLGPTSRAGDGVEKHGKDGVKVTGTVYLGDKNGFSKAGTIDETKIFEEIPAYQTIKKEGLKPDTARYHFLLRKANEVFKAAVKKAAKDGGYDLVVENEGIVVRDQKVPEITQAVIDAIEDE
ncbi:MAG: hypothetical protein AB1486_08880 [Planctomycetota bacterium]